MPFNRFSDPFLNPEKRERVLQKGEKDFAMGSLTRELRYRRPRARAREYKGEQLLYALSSLAFLLFFRKTSFKFILTPVGDNRAREVSGRVELYSMAKFHGFAEILENA